MCRTDAQMVDGYFEAYHPLTFPITPGHEIAGTVEKIGSLVPKTAALTEGDQVVVIGGWGDGTCRLCQAGNTQICGNGNWPGFGPPGGYGEFVPSRYDYLIRIDKKYNLKPNNWHRSPMRDSRLIGASKNYAMRVRSDRTGLWLSSHRRSGSLRGSVCEAAFGRRERRGVRQE